MSACMKTSCELCAAASNMQEWEFRNPAAPKGQQGSKLSNIEKHQGFEEMVPRVVWIKHQRIKALRVIKKAVLLWRLDRAGPPRGYDEFGSSDEVSERLRWLRADCQDGMPHTLNSIPFGSFWIFWFVEPIHSQNRGNSKWGSSMSMVFFAVICIYNLDCDAWWTTLASDEAMAWNLPNKLLPSA